MMRLGSIASTLAALMTSIVSAEAMAQATEPAAQPPEAQPGDVAPTPPVAAPANVDQRNAAIWYRQAIDKHRAINRTITQDQWMAVYDFEGDYSRGPAYGVRQTLRKLQPAIALTIRATRQPTCRFDAVHDLPDLAYAQYQHLGDMRGLARLIGYDVLARIHQGDARNVTEQIAALYRMAGHPPQEQMLVGSLVGSALLAFAEDRLDRALDYAIIGPPEAAVLLAELERHRGDDPMGFREALANERIISIGSMIERFSGEQGVERFRAQYGPAFAESDPAAAEALEQLTQEGLDGMLAGFAGAVDRMIEAAANPDSPSAEIAMNRLREEIDTGALGPFARHFIDFGGSVRTRMLRTRETIEQRRELLAGLADESIDPMSLANAAVWWIRATLQLDDVDPAKLGAIDAYAAKHDEPADELLRAILARHDVQTIVETLATAANTERCDFSYASSGWPSAFRPYHAGLLACGRILVADAARLFHDKQPAQAAARLAIGYRMSWALARDGHIAGSLAAHRIFNDVDALAAAAIDGNMLDIEQIALLHEQVRDFSRADPFHYQPSIAGMRRHLEYAMTYFVQGLPTDLPPAKPEQIDRAAAILGALQPDRLLSLMIVYEHWEPMFYKHRGRELAVAAAGLGAIFDLQALADAADIAPALSEWSRRREMELVVTEPLPAIALLEQRARESVNEFRRCLLRLDRLLQENR